MSRASEARPGTRKRRCRARSLLAGSIRATRRCRTHDVKQRSLLRSRGAFVRAGCGLALSGVAAATPLPSPTLRRASSSSPWRQRPVRPPDEGRAERRQAHSSLLFGRACEARPPRLCGAAPSRCERDPSRRSTVAIFGRGSTPPSPAVGHRSRQRIVRARPRGLADGIPDLPGLRFAPPPRDATPRSACRIVSGDAPQERGCECLSQLRYVVNSTVVSQSKFFACSGCESLAAGPPAAPFASGTAPLL